MDDIDSRAALLYQRTAKQLYSLAFYTIGNEKEAKEAAINAFIEAFLQLPDKSNIEWFHELSIKQLYKYGKRVKKQTNEFFIHREAHTPFVSPEHEKKESIQILQCLSYHERYILLLHYRYKFSLEKVAKTLGIPLLLTKKILNNAVKKTAAQWQSQ